MSLSRARFVHATKAMIDASNKGPPAALSNILTAEKIRGMQVGSLTAISIYVAIYADAHGIDWNELLMECGLPAEEGLPMAMLKIMVDDSRKADDVMAAVEEIGRRTH